MSSTHKKISKYIELYEEAKQIIASEASWKIKYEAFPKTEHTDAEGTEIVPL